MATSHWLGEPPRDRAGLAMWALARLAATAAEDTAFDATVDFALHPRDEDSLSGPYGDRALGGVPAPDGPRRGRRPLRGVSGEQWRERESYDPVLDELLDPAVLLRGVRDVTAARPVSRAGRAGIEVIIRPHPLFADPHSTWLPPAARTLTITVDTATGLLLDAELRGTHGTVATAHLSALDSPLPAPTGPSAIRAGTWTSPPDPPPAAYVLARMTTTLLEPARLTAQITIETETETDPPTADETSLRIADAIVTTPHGAPAQLALGGDYEPDQAGIVHARLSELITPARIVSHLRRVNSPAPLAVTAHVRPMRTFPFSAWAPEEDFTCTFSIDPTTGTLTSAETRQAERPLFRHAMTAHPTAQSVNKRDQ